MKNYLLILLSCLPVRLAAQEVESSLYQVDEQLEKNSKTLSQVFADPVYMRFHSLTVFREIIRQHAKSEKIIL